MSRRHVKYVLVGGGAASSAAVQAIRRHDPEGSMVLIGQEVIRPYNRAPLSKEYLRGETRRERLFTVPDGWFTGHNVELHTGRRASSLDPARQCIALDNGEEIAFAKLLIATGTTPKPLTVAGSELPNVFYLRTLADADRLHNAVEKARQEGRPHERGRGRALVVGAGLLGVEVASTLEGLGLAVDLVFTGPYPWHTFAGENVGRFVGRRMEGRGLKLHPLCTPLRFEGDGRVQRAIVPDHPPIECDFVVPAVGTVPHRELLRGTSIAAEKAILVDERCRTSHPAIYAAGDCAAILDPLFGKYRWLDHWPSAIAMGEVAGTNMAGVERRYDDVNRYYSEAFGLSLSVWGDSRAIERRIVRGNLNPDAPDFIEFGVTGDGRLSQILAVNHAGEDEILRQLLARRLSTDGREAVLREPASDLRSLLE